MGRAGGALLEQPCTAEWAGISGRIATDVYLRSPFEPNQPVKRILPRGETCGDDQILIVCDEGDVSSKGCSRKRRIQMHPKLFIDLNRLDQSEVDATASIFVPVRQPRNKRYSAGVVFPCVEFRARFSKVSGTWVEKRIRGHGYWP